MITVNIRCGGLCTILEVNLYKVNVNQWGFFKTTQEKALHITFLQSTSVTL